MDKEINFRFASLDEHRDLRIYNISACTAYDAVVKLILQVERPSLEMSSDATWYWNYSGCSTLASMRGSWNDLCSFVRC